MAPARLTRPLDPIYQESTWAQPVQFLNEDRTPKDLAGQTATMSMVRMGLPAAAEEVTGVYQGDGVFVFSGTDEETTDWTAGRYAIELNLDDAGAVTSMLVGEITVVKGAHAGGSAGMMPGAMQAASPVVGIVASATGAVQVVTVDRVSIDGVADNVSFDDTLTAMGVGSVQEAIAFLAGQQGYGPGTLNFSNPSNSSLIGVL